MNSQITTSQVLTLTLAITRTVQSTTHLIEAFPHSLPIEDAHMRRYPVTYSPTPSPRKYTYIPHSLTSLTRSHPRDHQILEQENHFHCNKTNYTTHHPLYLYLSYQLPVATPKLGPHIGMLPGKSFITKTSRRTGEKTTKTKT